MFTFKGNSYRSVSSGTRGKLSTLQISNEHCKAEISLFGAHLLSFIPCADNIDRLWVSPSAIYDKSKPIRGGVPICWPWFGPMYPFSDQKSEPIPAHGFVRTQDWHLVEIVESSTETRITLQPTQLGLYEFSEHLSVSLVISFSDKCSLELITENNSLEPAKITAALHTYFNITDINRTSIQGIEGKYIDQTNNGTVTEQSLPYSINDETDRIHLQDQSNQFNEIEVKGAQTTINIVQQGHDSVVVWNPWAEKSKSMLDMGQDAYLSMLCVEASITQGLNVEGKQQHSLIQVIS
ncbi:MAG: glucose-6-phosphate 1-epimerase [Glaciecola sp.]|jgi:glucose-6-phosphate 1-epimerase